MKFPLTTMLIRDGTTYFITVLAMNIAQLIVFQLTEQVYLISFICTLTAILVSRFFLDLREVALGGHGILGAESNTTVPGNKRFSLKRLQRRPRADTYELDDFDTAPGRRGRATSVALGIDPDDVEEELR
ncbi:hypothetical protein PHLGIDRAFT_230802 [Phlebiopsis gigantea 11061_1 CR5-6]|uniref:Uncharacterized protein n=1 Tax=Phlebiopsis gigantea (strain 11061_1 CR5-6) TaxID=745531 RepID=A0A0C3SEF9_PHLG1|nr:hypothetical protein PHLGIDRAFT_230802 [Phlebiopsis gigantea 11061_1 CR5-6]